MGWQEPGEVMNSIPLPPHCFIYSTEVHRYPPSPQGSPREEFLQHPLARISISRCRKSLQVQRKSRALRPFLLIPSWGMADLLMSSFRMTLLGRMPPAKWVGETLVSKGRNPKPRSLCSELLNARLKGHPVQLPL